MSLTRIQLTLFVTKPQAEAIERVRQTYNPAQYHLIPAHVTLCREDELPSPEQISEVLQALKNTSLNLLFGPPARFEEGRGLWLPALGGIENFQQLRKDILKDTATHPRILQPHITLMHPRNSCCTDDIFHRVKNETFPSSIQFDSISLIQQESGQKWQVLDEFPLIKP